MSVVAGGEYAASRADEADIYPSPWCLRTRLR
jgi:hypothetical protein